MNNYSFDDDYDYDSAAERRHQEIIRAIKGDPVYDVAWHNSSAKDKFLWFVMCFAILAIVALAFSFIL